MKKDAFHPINDLSIHFLSFLNLISFPPFLLPVLYVVLKLHSHVHNYTSPSSRASSKTRPARFSSIDFLLILTFLSSYVFFFASHSDNRIVHTLSMYQLIYTRPLLFGFLNGWDIGTVRSRLCLLNKCTPNVIRFPGRSKRVSLSSSLHNSTLPRTLWSPPVVHLCPQPPHPPLPLHRHLHNNLFPNFLLSYKVGFRLVS